MLNTWWFSKSYVVRGALIGMSIPVLTTLMLLGRLPLFSAVGFGIVMLLWILSSLALAVVFGRANRILFTGKYVDMGIDTTTTGSVVVGLMILAVFALLGALGGFLYGRIKLRLIKR